MKINLPHVSVSSSEDKKSCSIRSRKAGWGGRWPQLWRIWCSGRSSCWVTYRASLLQLLVYLRGVIISFLSLHSCFTLLSFLSLVLQACFLHLFLSFQLIYYFFGRQWEGSVQRGFHTYCSWARSSLWIKFVMLHNLTYVACFACSRCCLGSGWTFIFIWHSLPDLSRAIRCMLVPDGVQTNSWGGCCVVKRILVYCSASGA